MFDTDCLKKWFIYFPINHPILFIYCLINFLLSLYIYKKLYPFYDPKKEEAHKKYYVFRRLDKLNYYRLLIGLITIFWPRLILFVLFFPHLEVFSLIHLMLWLNLNQ